MSNLSNYRKIRPIKISLILIFLILIALSQVHCSQLQFQKVNGTFNVLLQCISDNKIQSNRCMEQISIPNSQIIIISVNNSCTLDLIQDIEQILFSTFTASRNSGKLQNVFFHWKEGEIFNDINLRCQFEVDQRSLTCLKDGDTIINTASILKIILSSCFESNPIKLQKRTLQDTKDSNIPISDKDNNPKVDTNNNNTDSNPTTDTNNDQNSGTSGIPSPDPDKKPDANNGPNSGGTGGDPPPNPSKTPDKNDHDNSEKENNPDNPNKGDSSKPDQQNPNNTNGENKNENENNKEEKKESEDASTWKIILIIGVVILSVIGCSVLIIGYIRREKDFGFASLKANLESDKQQMIKNGQVMSLGSSNGNNNNHMNNNENINNNNEVLSNNHSNQDNQNNLKLMNTIKTKQQDLLLPSSNNDSLKQSLSQEQQQINNKQIKKFSKRNINSINLKKPNESVKPALDSNSTIQLKVEHNNTAPMNDDSSKNTPNSKSNLAPLSSGCNSTNLQNSRFIHKDIITNNQISKTLNDKPDIVDNDQIIPKEKPQDTSVQNNFFSIDGEEDEKHNNKIIDSMHLDYQSDDTTYSNVFNLEGEESSKPNTNRKKKKKNKQQDHLFFENDKDAEN